ncbi:hypothetical protein BaRGS_00004089 [Batillaria attramentaria]|uniref:Uncharacterized protein n=1 Tax=Batillaria attramentaria TaxID=370345 RepID=A0ABD0LZZ0_9CAEN
MPSRKGEEGCPNKAAARSCAYVLNSVVEIACRPTFLEKENVTSDDKKNPEARVYQKSNVNRPGIWNFSTPFLPHRNPRSYFMFLFYDRK